MKIQKINTGILITKTAKQPSAKIEFSLDELDALSEFCEKLQDEKDIREYLNTAVTIPDSAEVSAPIAAKYLRDAALFEQLVDETRRNQEKNQNDFLTAVSEAVTSIEKSRDVKEWQGLTKETAERFAREFMAERNPGRWSGFGEVPESVSLDPLNFPINDIYPKGNKPALRMQLISVTYPSLHRVCECSIIEDGVDLWARRTLDSMTAGTVEDLVETVLYVARMYERSKCFERIFVNHIQMEKSEYDVLIRHLNDPDSINDEYYHHVVPQSENGSDTIGNIVGLCTKHHDLIHKDTAWQKKLAKKKTGLNKKYGALSVLNQIIPALTKELSSLFPKHFFVTNGKSTYDYRAAHGVSKDHWLDAYCIACSVLPNDTCDKTINSRVPYELKQFRRHDRRALNNENMSRVYTFNGKMVATNRHKATEQTTDSLEEFRQRQPNDVCNLKVKEHHPTYRNMNRNYPGSVFLVGNQIHVMQGIAGSKDGEATTYKDTNANSIAAGKCKFVAKNSGILFV